MRNRFNYFWTISCVQRFFMINWSPVCCSCWKHNFQCIYPLFKWLNRVTMLLVIPNASYSNTKRFYGTDWFRSFCYIYEGILLKNRIQNNSVKFEPIDIISYMYRDLFRFGMIWNVIVLTRHDPKEEFHHYPIKLVSGLPRARAARESRVQKRCVHFAYYTYSGNPQNIEHRFLYSEPPKL